MTETKIVFYPNQKRMQKGIRGMEKKGWEVVSTESVDRGYSGGKTCCLGLLFLPLALLGKKPKMWKVQYRRDK
jgi:hypothetical protein